MLHEFIFNMILLLILTCSYLFMMSTDDYSNLVYTDCGSKFNITNIKYRQCRGLFCVTTPEGEQEVVIKFQSNSYPFYSRELFHNIAWYHDNNTNHLTVHQVLCDGARVCSMVPKNGTHSLSAAITIDRDVTHYGIFTWESWNEETKRLLCIESIFFDDDAVAARSVFSLD